MYEGLFIHASGKQNKINKIQRLNVLWDMKSKWIAQVVQHEIILISEVKIISNFMAISDSV